MSLATLQVFSDWAYASLQETLGQKVDLFNSASQGTIVLTSGSNTGDYSDEANWQRIPNLVQSRDPYASAVNNTAELSQSLETTVKVALNTPTVSIDAAWLEWINKNPAEAGQVYGAQLAEARMQTELNDIIASGVVSLQSTPTATYDATAGTLDLGALNVGASKFGDSSQLLSAWIMHSKSLFDVYGTALANAENLFQFGTVRVVQDGFGRPLIITDSPDLHFDNAGTENYHTLGLVQGALNVEYNGDFNQNVASTNGNNNINSTIQSEWSNNYKVKGFSWDKVNGGVAPDAATIRTAGNWDAFVANIKDGPGVAITSL